MNTEYLQTSLPASIGDRIVNKLNNFPGTILDIHPDFTTLAEQLYLVDGCEIACITVLYDNNLNVTCQVSRQSIIITSTK